MTASNVLVDQALDTYPGINYLIGKTHYPCKEFPQLSCEERQLLDHTGCKGCRYRAAKTAAFNGAPTVYNPISYYYSTFDKRFKVPPVICVDEAHTLNNLLMLLVATSFGKRWAPPPEMGQVALVEWLKVMVERLQAIPKSAGEVARARAADKLAKIDYLIDAIREKPDDFVHWYEQDGSLKISPIDVPRKFIDTVIQTPKLILLSATLFKDDVKEIVGEAPFEYLELDSPIPKERRPILYEPSPVPITWESDVRFMAELIRRTLARHPSPSTLVHVTYGLSQKLAELIPGALWNTKETKAATLKQFKRDGGLWFAAGCAEGLDLYDDYCRLNVILRLHKPNLTDTLVQKKLNRPGGRRWYDLEILRTLMQQVGRSTRHEMDESKAIILDPMFPRLFKQYKSELPKSFTEAVLGVK